MKKILTPEMKIAGWITVAFSLGFIPFYAVCDPFWFAVITNRAPIFPNVIGALIGVALVSPFFFTYFFIAVNFAILMTRFTQNKIKRILLYFVTLAPFLGFNLFAYTFVTESVEGWARVENYILFFLGVILIILPTIVAFVFFCEKHYCQTQLDQNGTSKL